MDTWNDRIKAIEEMIAVTKEKVLITMDVIAKAEDGQILFDEGFDGFLKHFGVKELKSGQNVI